MNEPLAGLDANELDARDSHRAMVEHFGQHEEETQPAPLLELVPLEQDERTKQLTRAGLISPPLRRRTSDWDGSRAATDRAHAIEVNERPTNNLGLWA